MQYLKKYTDTFKKSKFGVDISVFGSINGSDIVYEETETGCFEEFYNDVSTHTWFIIEGSGIFVIDDESIKVNEKDIISIPPKKRIHYFGKMRMLLITSPEWKEENEHHVRNIEISDSPYK